MGPRSEERGNLTSDRALALLGQGFNGAALRGARKRYLLVLQHHPFGQLQWGRAQRSAETRYRFARLRGTNGASMGPRSEERGNAIRHRAPLQPRTSFNGAALRGARKPAHAS